MATVALVVAVLTALVHVTLLVGAITVAVSIVRFETAASERSLLDIEAWQPISNDECLLAVLLLFLSGITFVHGLQPVRHAHPRPGQFPSSWLPRASGLRWLKIKFLDGKVRSLPFVQAGKRSAHVSMRNLPRSFVRCALGAVAASARLAYEAGERAADVAARAAEWRRHRKQQWWSKLSQGARVFYLLVALFVNSIPPPESAATAAVPTPSQLATNPFISPHTHSAHLAEHQLEQLLAFGPQGFDSLLASPLPCNVTLDFSLLDASTPQITFESVPSNETVQSMMVATAALMGQLEAYVGLLHNEFTSPNPLTPLSALSVYGRVELLVVPRNRVGGDCTDTCDDCTDATDTPSYPHDATDTPSYPRDHRYRRCNEQPAPVEHPSRHVTQRWYCKAFAEKERTGKAQGKWDPKYQEFSGPTEEDVLRKRERWLYEFEHPKPRAAPTGKRFAPDIPEREPRAKRGAAPENLAEPKFPAGPSSAGASRAGPGRGRTFEPAASKGSSSTLLEEPTAILEAKSTNWLAQASQRKQWQTERINQLEEQLAAALCREQAKDCVIAQQAEAIAQLRARVHELEAEELQLAEQLLSHIHTDGPLKQASHAKALLDDANWQAVLGVGYRDDQKRSLVYQHVSKLMDRTREITGGDPQKAKYLVDLM